MLAQLRCRVISYMPTISPQLLAGGSIMACVERNVVNNFILLLQIGLGTSKLKC